MIMPIGLIKRTENNMNHTCNTAARMSQRRSKIKVSFITTFIPAIADTEAFSPFSMKANDITSKRQTYM